MEKRNSSLWCNLLFHSAFTTYLGNQNERTREEFKDTWLALLREYDNGVPFDVLQPYAKDLRRWQIWGLNRDNTSLHNAAIIASCSWKVCQQNLLKYVSIVCFLISFSRFHTLLIPMELPSYG